MTKTLGALALALSVAAPAYANDTGTSEPADQPGTTETRQANPSGSEGSGERKEGEGRQ